MVASEVRFEESRQCLREANQNLPGVFIRPPASPRSLQISLQSCEKAPRFRLELV